MSRLFKRHKDMFDFYVGSNEIMTLDVFCGSLTGELKGRLKKSSLCPDKYFLLVKRGVSVEIEWNHVVKQWKFLAYNPERKLEVRLEHLLEDFERKQKRRFILLASLRPDNPVGRAFSSPLGDVNLLRELLEWV